MKFKRLLIIFAMFLVASWPILPAKADTLSDLEEQQRQLQAQIDEITRSLSAKNQEVKSFQDLISQVQNQINATSREISLQNQKINLLDQQINELTNQINQKQAELVTQKANLGETLKTLYENGNPSTLEIILSSNSLSDVINREQYLESVSASLDATINTITQIQEQLKNDQASLQAQQADLVNTKNSLVEKQRNLAIQKKQQNSLLSKSAADQAQIQANLKSVQADKDNVSAQIYALRQAEGGYTSGGTGGYPYAYSSTSGVDPWGFYYRQCTSYAAWYFNAIEGKPWFSFRWLGINRPSNGGDWAALGAYQGYSVSSTPRAGAIVSWPAGGIFGGYGHVAIVRSVNANGTINVSEYNWIPYAYDERNNVSPAGASFIY